MSDPTVMAPARTVKLCECGCGQPAKISKRTDTAQGYVAGQPRRFLAGHFSKTSQHRQNMAEVDPERTKHIGETNGNWKGGRSVEKSGYVYLQINGRRRAEHRVVMEEKLGRKLKAREVVHHINEDRQDNRLENLELYASGGEHIRHHWKDARFRSNLSGTEKGERIRNEIAAGKRKPPPHYTGERNPSSKLTDQQVREIFSAKGKRTQVSLAAEYGVKQSTISAIHLGKCRAAALAVVLAAAGNESRHQGAEGG